MSVRIMTNRFKTWTVNDYRARTILKDWVVNLKKAKSPKIYKIQFYYFSFISFVFISNVKIHDDANNTDYRNFELFGFLGIKSLTNQLLFKNLDHLVSKLFSQNKKFYYKMNLDTGVSLNPWMNCWNSVSWVDCWIAGSWAFAVSPWNISEKNVFSSLFDGEWTARITHARSDTIGISTLLTSSDSWSSPDTFTLRIGNTLDVGPLESWSNCTWVASNMLKHSFSIISRLNSGIFMIFDPRE